MDIVWNIGFFTGQNSDNIMDCIVNTSIGTAIIASLEPTVTYIAKFIHATIVAILPE